MNDLEREELDNALFVFAVNAGREDEAIQAVLRIGRIVQLTGLPEATLRERLGCSYTKHLNTAPRQQADETVRHSLAYLDWVLELALLVSLQQECRDIVSGAYELCAGAGGPVGERVARCRAAVERTPEGSMLSAREYFELGEVSQGWHVAALQLDHGPAKEQAQLAESLMAPLEPHLHIHPERLALLNQPDAKVRLGTSVHAAMRVHCDRCSRCCAYATPGPGVVVPPLGAVVPASPDVAA